MKIIVVIVLLIAVFLAGFLPEYATAKHLENELRDARQENSLAQLRDLVGLACLQASQKDYGLAAGTSTRFFDRTREVAKQQPDSSGRTSVRPMARVATLERRANKSIMLLCGAAVTRPVMDR